MAAATASFLSLACSDGCSVTACCCINSACLAAFCSRACSLRCLRSAAISLLSGTASSDTEAACFAFALAIAAATAGFIVGVTVSVTAACLAFTRAMAAATASSPPVVAMCWRRSVAALANRFSRSALSRSIRCCLASKR